MKRTLPLLLAAAFLLSFAADKPAYRLYNPKGKQVRYSKMLKTLSGADIILFGEYHDNPISHWLQRELAGDLYELRSDSLILGAEMFEADMQLLIDEFFGGMITEAKFEDEARLWPNYKTDYKPLVDLARENNLQFVASNIPRRYANLVFREGFGGLEQLSAEARQYIAPLPIPYDQELNCYKSMLEMGHMGGMGNPMENLPRAQAIKDATMAYFILKAWEPGKIFLHFNGSGHSDNHEGIVWYLRQEVPELKILTITTVMQEDPDILEEESAGKADFTIVVPETMTRTY